MTNLTKNFTYAELACPTSGEATFEQGFPHELQELRDALNFSMPITSGARSTEHNEWLLSRGYPASESSLHLIGNPKYHTDCCAVDVDTSNYGGHTRGRLVHLALDRGWSVGIAKTFIHIDLRAKYIPLPQILYVY